ncbi:MAG: DUF6994 family protein [Sporichthyaceae bacterium]
MIDTTFDFRSDSNGRDPDRYSPTLLRYHRLLWSKPLPDGRPFDLVPKPREYLYHRSDIGEFYLSSDAVIASYSTYVSAAHIIGQLPPEDVERFEYIGYTIGGMLLFPSNRVDGKHTINQARGSNRFTIGDRMDLTLECIRRHYRGDRANALGPTLERYPEFFALFGDFAGYCEFFLLQDLVRDDGSVKFFAEFDDFQSPAMPSDAESYVLFREQSIRFVEARNLRIKAWSVEHLECLDPGDF